MWCYASQRHCRIHMQSLLSIPDYLSAGKNGQSNSYFNCTSWLMILDDDISAALEQ